MKLQRKAKSSCRALDARLAAYVAAAGAVSAVAASEANAIVVGNNTVQPFGINGEVRIDFNQDGQTDFSIDHDRVTLPSGGPTLDYLQVDKNDINGESNPLAFDPGPPSFLPATPFSDGVTTRNDANNAAYVITGAQGSYPAALTLGSTIGPASTFDFQEGDNFQSVGKWIRANRLIDEDASLIDQVLGGRAPSGIQVPIGTPGFASLAPTDVRYLGVKMELNDTGDTNYGWIGIRITNAADATGEVVGYAYETTPGQAIAAGNVPEPATVGGALMGLAMVFSACWRRLVRR